MIGPLRKRLTKDGALRWDEERDASFLFAKMLTKTHTGNLAKTHDGNLAKGLIHDVSQHGGNKEAETGIGDSENKTGNDGATHNDPHHSIHGVPSEGPDEEEQESQGVDSGKDIQAREELREGHHGDNVPTKEEGDGDEQDTGAGGGGGGGERGHGGDVMEPTMTDVNVTPIL